MKKIILLFALCLPLSNAFSQLEVTGGYAVNKSDSEGFPLHIGYDFKIKNSFFLQSHKLGISTCIITMIL